MQHPKGCACVVVEKVAKKVEAVALSSVERERIVEDARALETRRLKLKSRRASSRNSPLEARRYLSVVLKKVFSLVSGRESESETLAEAAQMCV